MASAGERRTRYRHDQWLNGRQHLSRMIGMHVAPSRFLEIWVHLAESTRLRNAFNPTTTHPDPLDTQLFVTNMVPRVVRKVLASLPCRNTGKRSANPSASEYIWLAG